jgi:cation diffusion facilitator family transporter
MEALFMDRPMPHNKEETKQVERVGLYSFLVNLGLAGLKASLSYYSGSLAIIASTVDSVTDSVASVAVWGGLKLSTRKSRAFPYGLYKIENLIQVIMALLIFLIGYEIAHKVISPGTRPPTITTSVIVGMALSVLAPLLFGWYTIAVGKRTGSPALLADGRHRQADVLSSLVVLGAVVFNYLGLTGHIYFGLTADRIAAGLMLIFIGYAGVELLVNGMRVLLDASIDSETLAQALEIIKSEPTVIEVPSLVGRNAGRYRFLEAEVSLRTADLEKAHAVSERIKANIRKEVSRVDRVLIHCEPRKKETLVVAIPVESNRETMSEYFGEAPIFYLGVLRESDGQLLEERFIPNPFLDEKKAKGIKVSQWLLQQGMDRVYTSKNLEGRGAGYVLSDAGVDVRLLQGGALSEIRKEWGRLVLDTQVLKENTQMVCEKSKGEE